MPSTSFKRFWRVKNYLNETDILEMLPFADDIQDGQVTQGIYIVPIPFGCNAPNGPPTNYQLIVLDWFKLIVHEPVQ